MLNQWRIFLCVWNLEQNAISNTHQAKLVRGNCHWWSINVTDCLKPLRPERTFWTNLYIPVYNISACHLSFYKVKIWRIVFMGLGPEILSGYCKLPLISPAPSYRPSTCTQKNTYVPFLAPITKKALYSLTSPYGHLYNMDTSLLWTVHLVSEMPKIIHSLPL